ncbi:hypothetical protein [Dongia sp.]|jgi:hypothetical protein|uniref:hypothetical protein n=1 Tax=Dongia sp. TaxID=1977262 RepID=UPI0034A15582
MTVHATVIGIDNKSASPAIGLSPDLSEIVALRRDRWFDGPESTVSTNHAAPVLSSDQDADIAWQRLARQRLGIGMALVDVANGLAYAVDVGPEIFLYRVIAARQLERHLGLDALIASGEVAAARFAANGILEWVPVTAAADLAQVRNAARRLGATPLRGIFALSPLRTEGGLRMISSGGTEPLTLDLTPPNIGQHRYPQARRFAWAEQDAPMSYGFGAPAAEQMPIGLAALFSQPWQ